MTREPEPEIVSQERFHLRCDEAMLRGERAAAEHMLRDGRWQPIMCEEDEDEEEGEDGEFGGFDD